MSNCQFNFETKPKKLHINTEFKISQNFMKTVLKPKNICCALKTLCMLIGFLLYLNLNFQELSFNLKSFCSATNIENNLGKIFKEKYSRLD